MKGLRKSSAAERRGFGARKAAQGVSCELGTQAEEEILQKDSAKVILSNAPGKVNNSSRVLS